MVMLRPRRRAARAVPRFAVGALGLAIAILLAVPAAAQSSSDQAAAEALFKQGRDLMAAGQYTDACPKLAESERLDPAPGTLLNLATCYERSGQVASAWVTYKEAATAARNADQAERARMATDKATELEPSLPTLTIVVSPAADEADLQVRRDGELVGRAEWGVAIPVDPGVHVVDARAPGRKPWTGQASIAGVGAKASLDVPVLEALPATTVAPSDVPAGPAATAGATVGADRAVVEESVAPPQAARRHPGATQRTVAWVAGAVGLAGVAAGAVFGAIALSDNNQAMSGGDCTANVCDAHGVSTTNDAKHAATASTLALAAGGGLVAVGLVLWIASPADPHSAAGRVEVAPLVGAESGGAVIRGSF